IKQLFLLVNILHDSVQISKMAYHYYRITTSPHIIRVLLAAIEGQSGSGYNDRHVGIWNV
ncbi:MAG: hypothetical protein ACKPA9_07435, partial [Microcystis sp.]